METADDFAHFLEGGVETSDERRAASGEGVDLDLEEAHVPIAVEFDVVGEIQVDFPDF